MSVSRWALVAASLAILVHVGALANGFAYDDHVLIAGDPGLRSLSGLPERLMEPSWPSVAGDEVGAWRPVTTGTWALTWIASGGSAVAFHALGIVLHAVVTALVVLLLAELAPVGVAAAGGLLFAVHPVHVEAVANVTGTSEPLSALFLFTALLLHVRGGHEYGLGRVLAVTATYALAVLAKEGAAVMPLLVLLLDGARRDVGVRDLADYVRRRGILYAMLGAVLAVILAYRLDVVGAVAAATHPPGAAVLRDAPRSWTVFSIWPEYLRLLVFPFDLAADYAPRVLPVAFGWTARAVAGVLVGLVAFAGAWVIWRREAPLLPSRPNARLVALGVLWSAAALLPVANVLYLGPVLVAERTLYVASWGAAAAGGWLVVRLAGRDRRRAVALLAVVVLLAGVRSVARVPAWASDDAVMGALLDDHPESGTGWLYLGGRLAQQGRGPEARVALRYAIGLLNSDYATTTQIASHLMAMNRPDQARTLLERAWRDEPGWYTAPGLLAAIEVEAGRPDRAAPPARAAIAIRPTNPSMHQLLAQAMVGLGRWDEAIRARRAALANGFSDRSRTWMLLSADHAAAGDTASALAALDSAALRPMTDDERAALVSLRGALDIDRRRP